MSEPLTPEERDNVRDWLARNPFGLDTSPFNSLLDERDTLAAENARLRAELADLPRLREFHETFKTAQCAMCFRLCEGGSAFLCRPCGDRVGAGIPAAEEMVRLRELYAALLVCIPSGRVIAMGRGAEANSRLQAALDAVADFKAEAG